MVDLDSSPTRLIEIVEIGKQPLMTRGALTTFAIANDVTATACWTVDTLAYQATGCRSICGGVTGCR
jgi:high-affinity K+ transport system ATPase subunit B